MLRVAGLLALICAVPAGCARDRESVLRAQLAEWFFLGDTLYFRSRARCTGAVFSVSVDRPRPALAVAEHPDDAKAALREHAVAAIRVEGVSPAMLTDAMLLSGAGSFGKQALAAGALSVACFEGSEAGAALYEALNRPGATLIYDAGNAGLMVLDPARYRVYYVAGDVW